MGDSLAATACAAVAQQLLAFQLPMKLHLRDRTTELEAALAQRPNALAAQALSGSLSSRRASYAVLQQAAAQLQNKTKCQ